MPLPAVVDWNGASDLTTLAAAKDCSGSPRDPLHSPEAVLLGCSVASCPATAASASPVSYVTADDPPFLLLHASSACLFPPPQSQELASALLAKGVAVRLEIYNGDDNVAIAAAEEFLDAVLRDNKRRAAGR